MKRIYAAALVLTGMTASAGPANACLNDRDSDALALQARNFPETVQVIAGRFPRNPDLYYEMRVARVEKELKQNPSQLSLYDDLGVALDHLHRDGEAMRWMEAKKRRLPKYDAKNPAVKEAWYRYYANDGTFRLHYWLRTGAKQEELKELRTGIFRITTAMKIKPNSHFGRERFQLFAMQWLLDMKTGRNEDTLAEYLEEKDKWEDTLFEANNGPRRTKAVEGLSGLIVLGSAWESPDFFAALSEALNQKAGSGLGYMANLRCDDLLRTGTKPFFRNLSVDDYGFRSFRWAHYDANPKMLRELYGKLRTEADLWQAQRTAFMMDRLKAGRHPDTDKGFWDGYVETPAPKIEEEWMTKESPLRSGMGEVVLGGGAIAFIVGVFFLRRGARRRREES